ncbi:MAG: GlyGly-CTERM sorting domain-containing protein [Bryobacteraceae bacterium]
MPAGLYFTGLGIILCAYGLLFPNVRAQMAADINVNLYSGIAMGVFGLALLALAWRKRA